MYYWCVFGVQVSAKALETAVFGAYYNVVINLKDIKDHAFKTAVSTSCLAESSEGGASLRVQTHQRVFRD